MVDLVAPSAAAVPVRRRPRLADLPAPPLLALAPLVPHHRPAVMLRPISSDRVMAEAGSGACCALLELDGQLSRPLYLPRAALITLAKRHPLAERLVIDANDDGLLLFRAINGDSSATVICSEADALVGSVATLLQAVPLLALGDEQQALINPQLLRKALAVLIRISGDSPIALAMPAHDTLAVVLHARPAAGSDLIRAAIALARMIEVDDDGT